MAKKAKKKVSLKIKKKSKTAGPKNKLAAAKKGTTPAKSKARTASRTSKAQPTQTKITLGKPTISGEEKLYMLFHGDYHARQIFEFLQVDTVKELEKFSPGEIIDRLSKPIHDTVQRIREQLARRNRCLAGDEKFVIEYRSKLQAAQAPAASQ